MRVTITVEDDDGRKSELSPAAEGVGGDESRAAPSDAGALAHVGDEAATPPAGLLERAAAIGASSGGPAPSDTMGAGYSPPPFVPEEPGGTSTPLETTTAEGATSAGPAPFGPAPEPPVALEEDASG